MTVAEIKEKLDEAGIEYDDDALKADLEALLPEEEEEEKEKPSSNKGKFIVLDANGKPFRTFDKEDEAKAFAKSVNGRIKL